jgi:hypothetical protein
LDFESPFGMSSVQDSGDEVGDLPVSERFGAIGAGFEQAVVCPEFWAVGGPQIGYSIDWQRSVKTPGNEICFALAPLVVQAAAAIKCHILSCGIRLENSQSLVEFTPSATKVAGTTRIDPRLFVRQREKKG